MPISYAQAALTSGQALSNAWLNDIATTLETKFDHKIGDTETDATPANRDFTYPIVLQGPIDFGQYRIKGLTTLANIRFADQFTSIQAAINDLPVTGGIVVLGPKKYTLTSPLDMQGASATKHNVTLVGLGQASQLYITTGFTGAAAIILSKDTSTQSQKMVVYNLYINIDNATMSTVHGIQANKTTGSIVRNVVVVNGTRGVDLNRATDTSVIGCEFYNTQIPIYRDTDSAASSPSTDTRIIIRDNILWLFSGALGQGGIHITAIPTQCLITGNILYTEDADVDGIRISCQSGFDSDPAKISIQNNVIYLLDTVLPVDGDGIFISGNSQVFRGLSIVNNVIIGFVNGINLGVGTLRTVVCGSNTIIDSGVHGFSMGPTVNGRQLAICGNSFYSWNANTGGLTGYAVNIDGGAGSVNAKRISITQNAFVYQPAIHNNRPAYAIVYDADTTRSLFYGNTAKGCIGDSAFGNRPWSFPADVQHGDGNCYEVSQL